ncbi:hypothetical protein [Parabacteroides provencensis]|uniref:hypothetical protein n=1 Tax=Parabacteroides provencensis TaxID=1944636 RepID=UPI00117DAC97|nr:hypothetical protein [Parabacteroides provencensis]
MKKLLILLFSILIFSSCTTNYFLCETACPVKLYTSPNTHSAYIEVPVGKNLISTGKYKKYRKAKYGNRKGYVYKTKFRSEKKIRYLSDWEFDSETSTYKYSRSNYTLSNSSKYNYKSTSTGGTVHVKGYYRKNGTYVKPHTRRAPSRRR